MRLLNAYHSVELFESDEGKKDGIISVDGCEVSPRLKYLALAAAVKMDNAFANRGRV